MDTHHHVVKYHKVILELIHLINHNPEWYNRFIEALKSVLKYDLDEFSRIHTLNDWIIWCNELLHWIPTETSDGHNVDKHLITFYFFINQPSLSPLQKDPVFIKWMKDYAKELGEFFDSTDSLTKESIESFYSAPIYRMNEYMQTPSRWKTFNQLFARHVKPGFRPIDCLCDDRIIVSVADSKYKGSWPITSESKITAKGIEWSIAELLHNNPYADCFKCGTFMHAYLSPMDYHRLHTPLPGKVLYSEVVPGNVYLETYVANKKLNTHRSHYTIQSRDGVGYQFSQARGILILQTPIGIIAVLPIGMSFVSSVILTTEVGAQLHKGQEFGYFQFGASDYIILFPRNMKVNITAKIGTHYNQGKEIAHISK